MKPEEFSRLAKGITDFEDLYLEKLYNSILKTPLSVHHLERKKQEIKEFSEADMKQKINLQKKFSDSLISDIKNSIRVMKNTIYNIPQHNDFRFIIFKDLIYP